MTIETVGKYRTQLLLDILTDGIEWSARQFWAQIEKYDWPSWYQNGQGGFDDHPRDDMTPDTVLMRVRDTRNEEGRDIYQIINNHTPDVRMVAHFVDGQAAMTDCGLRPYPSNWDFTPFNVEVEDCTVCIKWVEITPAKLAEATDWALENYNHLFSSYTVEKGIRTDIDYDAIGADVIIQKIVLGEVVYG